MPTTTAESKILANTRAFCESRGIGTDGVFALTVQRNRTSEFASIVIRWGDAGVLLPGLSSEAAREYREMRVGDFLVSYVDGLPPTAAAAQAPGAPLASDRPFCCASVAPYKHRRVSGEQMFADLLEARGHHPNVVFEVKEQVDNGPHLGTNYYVLEDGMVRTVKGPFTQKMHCYKNYKCAAHNRFFAVDLYHRNNDAVRSNYHHMRLVPFTKRNDALLTEFFRAAAL